MARRRPASIVEAQFSVPFLVAATLFYGKLTPELFADEMILVETEILAIADRVEIFSDPEADRVYNETHTELRSAVTIAFADDSQMSARVHLPKGEASNPMSQRELFDKFDYQCAPALGLSATRILRGKIMTLENAPNLTLLLNDLDA